MATLYNTIGTENGQILVNHNFLCIGDNYMIRVSIIEAFKFDI